MDSQTKIKQEKISCEEVMVSILCYAYNHEKFIADAIEGFLMQKTSFPFEIIIHDDASTDRTAEIVEQYQEKYGKIIHFIQEEENIYSKYKNFKRIDEKMLKEANGKYLAICEGDDYWIDEYKLKKQIGYMEANPDCTLCFHNSLVVDEKKNIISYIFPRETSSWRYQYFKGYGRYDTADMLLWDHVATASMLFRKKDFLEMPSFLYDYIYDDMIMRQCLTNMGYAYFMRDTMSAYRTGHCGSMMTAAHSSMENRMENIRGSIDIYKRLNEYMGYKYDKEIQEVIKHWEDNLIYSYDFQGWRWWTRLDGLLDYCRLHKKVYLYGAGLYGHFCDEKLKHAGIDISGYIISEGQARPENYNEHESFYLHEIMESLSDAGIVICVGSSKYVKEMSHNLDTRCIQDYMVLKIAQKERIITKECEALTGGRFLKLRITNRCPGKCRFCGLKGWTEEERRQEMNPKWYYEYLKPMYPYLKTLALTGGDCFVAKEAYSYMKFISDNYPHITIWTESNGVPFVEKFQKIACDNLFRTHFSVNASNADTFMKGCWEGEKGNQVFDIIIKNIKHYIELLKQNNKEVFAPSISMVVNKDTADDVVDFVKMALTLGVSYVIFYFDYTENDMKSDYFTYPEISRAALRKIMEMERVLRYKFFIFYDLELPMKEMEIGKGWADASGTEALRTKYTELLELAEGRSIEGEFKQRNQIRKIQGKDVYTLEEDYIPELLSLQINGKRICKMPWNGIDLYPSGRVDFCGWHVPILNLYDFIENDAVDWNRIINSKEYKTFRSNILHDDYSGCMKNCPYNGQHKKIKSYFDYLVDEE